VRLKPKVVTGIFLRSSESCAFSFRAICLRTLASIYRRVLSAFCADTLVVVYFGWQSTVAFEQPTTPDAMVSFAGFAFWPALFISLWLVGHVHSLTA
jgi:hypothetical protein